MNNFKGRSFSFLGRSGSGKSTQFDFLEKRLKDEGCSMLRIASGNLMRELAEKNTVIGRKIKDVMGGGGLMPAWAACLMWERELVDRLSDNDTVLFFDGSPRRLPEAQTLDDVLPWLGRDKLIPIYLDTHSEEATRRLKARGRGDDHDEAIKKRLEWFEQDVAPIVDYYKSQSRLLTVDGVGTVDEVFERVLAAINDHA